MAGALARGDFLSLLPRLLSRSPVLRAVIFNPKQTIEPRSNGCTGKSACATVSAANQVAEELFDAGLFAPVLLVGNRARLLAKLEAKNLFL